MSDVHAELKETYEQQQQMSMIARHLDQLNTQLKAAYGDLDLLEKKLRKEFRDIEKLEKLSVKGLFHKVLGSKEQQIEKERQEYLEVSLKYDEAKKSVELLEYERNLLDGKVKTLPQIESRLAALIKAREKALIDSNSLSGRQILEIHMRIDQKEALMREVEHVKSTGGEVISLLENIVRLLQEARNWGQWDMTGRHRHASHMKHSAIDRAKDLAYQSKHRLVRFQQDLEHLFGPQQFDLNLEFNKFNRFTDMFFDNLISDWIVQQKIQNTLSNVQAVRDKTIRIVQSLDAEIKKAESEIANLEEQRKQIIIKA